MLEMEIKTRWEDAVMASRVDDGSAAATGNGNMVCHGNINRNGRSLTNSLAGWMMYRIQEGYGYEREGIHGGVNTEQRCGFGSCSGRTGLGGG